MSEEAMPLKPMNAEQIEMLREMATKGFQPHVTAELFLATIDAIAAERDRFRTRVEEMTQTLDILTSQLGPEKPNLAAEIARRETAFTNARELLIRAEGTFDLAFREASKPEAERLNRDAFALLAQLRTVLG